MYRSGTFPTQEAIDARVARFASRRHGVLSRADAVRLGATDRMIHRLVSTHRWERLHAGVYRVGGAPRSWRQDLLAACLPASEGAVASHRAMAVIWRLPGFEAVAIEITVPRGRRARLHGVTVHQLPLPPVDVTTVDAIPATTPARTLLDLAAVVPADALEEALDDALRRGLATLPRLRWRFEELGPRRSAGTIRRLLAARGEGDQPRPQSVLETRLLRLLKRARLPTPACQHQVRDRGRLIAVVDFAYPNSRLAIEADGYRWHSGRARWQHDLTRRNELTRLGWRVIHVSAHDLDRRTAATLRIVAEALNRLVPELL